MQATPRSQKASSKADIFKRKRRGDTADWQGLKRDTISWWPDGPADKMLIGSWDLIGFSIYWWVGEQHTSADFLTDIWIFTSVCVCVRLCARMHMCKLTFLFERASNQTCLYTSSPMWTNRGGMFMRLGCLPLLLLAVSLKKMPHCITPFAGHRQSHSTAANENVQNKQYKTGAVRSTSSWLHCGSFHSD